MRRRHSSTVTSNKRRPGIGTYNEHVNIGKRISNNRRPNEARMELWMEIRCTRISDAFYCLGTVITAPARRPFDGIISSDVVFALAFIYIIFQPSGLFDMTSRIVKRFIEWSRVRHHLKLSRRTVVQLCDIAPPSGSATTNASYYVHSCCIIISTLNTHSSG